MVSTLARRPDTDPETVEDGRTPPGAGGSAKIELSGVTKRFVSPTGALNTAIRDVDLVIEPGQFCAIVGPTVKSSSKPSAFSRGSWAGRGSIT